MPNNQVNADGGGNGAMTALLAILVIAVVAFGLWYVMRGNAAPAADNDDASLNIEIGGSSDANGSETGGNTNNVPNQ